MSLAYSRHLGSPARGMTDSGPDREALSAESAESGESAESAGVFQSGRSLTPNTTFTQKTSISLHTMEIVKTNLNFIAIKLRFV